MPYYGDISGSFKCLLSGDIEVCVAVVVGGTEDDCLRCPKRTVRNDADVSEARWYDLRDMQKRRFMDCLRDNREDLSAGYAIIRETELRSLSSSYKIYPPDAFSEWPILLRGVRILRDTECDSKHRRTFSILS